MEEKLWLKFDFVVSIAKLWRMKNDCDKIVLNHMEVVKWSYTNVLTNFTDIKRMEKKSEVK